MIETRSLVSHVFEPENMDPVLSAIRDSKVGPKN